MTRDIFEFDAPERFVAGAVGEPGSRTFYLQARKGQLLISVALEKAQVAALAARVVALVAAVKRAGFAEGSEETVESGGQFASAGTSALAGSGSSKASGELEEPVVDRFRVRTLALGWDADERQIVVEARADTDEDEDDDDDDEELIDFSDASEDGPDVLRVRLEPDAATRFAESALRVVAAGRPPCPFCGEPLDPQGHLCPRRNGFVH